MHLVKDDRILEWVDKAYKNKDIIELSSFFYSVSRELKSDSDWALN